MKTEHINKFEEAINAATALRNSYNTYLQKAGRGSCDKYGLGFNIDNRFSSMSLTVSLDSWLGYFGDSSCYTALSNNKLLANAFIRYLNSNKDSIINEMIKFLEQDALEYKKAAEAEIAMLQEKMNSIGKEEETHDSK